MKKEDIYNEIITKLEIKIDDTLFYIPGETIKGKININPKYQMKINDTTLHLTFKIMQYEFWDYSNQEIQELKNINITTVQTGELIYELKKEDLSEHKNFENFSIIEKEDESKIISIPFELKINEENILPTFQYDDKTYFLGIRHLLLVECKEYNSSNYIGLFIGKKRNKDFIESKEIIENYMVGLGSLEIKVAYPTLSYKFDEVINLDIETKPNLYFKKVTEIEQKFYRNIHWVGYMKNTLLNKEIFHTQKYELNMEENKYGIIAKINAPLIPIEYSIIGAVGGLFKGLSENIFEGPIEFVVGTIAGIPNGIIHGIKEGFSTQKDIVKEVLNLDKNTKGLNNNFKMRMNNDDIDEELLNESLKKFVYFKDDKIVGFIKFAKDITPPVEGYYFKCDFNIKIEVLISGIILNRNRYLKTQIDMYDSEKYINKKKKLLKS